MPGTSSSTGSESAKGNRRGRRIDKKETKRREAILRRVEEGKIDDQHAASRVGITRPSWDSWKASYKLRHSKTAHILPHTKERMAILQRVKAGEIDNIQAAQEAEIPLTAWNSWRERNKSLTTRDVNEADRSGITRVLYEIYSKTERGETPYIRDFSRASPREIVMKLIQTGDLQKSTIKGSPMSVHLTPKGRRAFLKGQKKPDQHIFSIRGPSLIAQHSTHAHIIDMVTAFEELKKRVESLDKKRIKENRT